MPITFEFFGVLRRLAGAPTRAASLAPAATVADALEQLAREVPALHPELPRCACAIADCIVPRTQALVPGATLALLPPVSGG